MAYWTAYLVVALSSWAFHLPWIALVAALVVALRAAAPDPVAYVRRARVVRELRERVGAHPGDLLARRQLASAYLDARKPREACALLEEAIAKGLHDAQAFYLLGLARLRAGDPAAALEPLVRSVSQDEHILMGAAYFAAGEALVALARYPEAEDALERGLRVNTSRADAQLRLGRVRELRGDAAGARRAYDAAVDTWHKVPGYLQREMLVPYLAARWRRARVRVGAAVKNHPQG